MWHSWNGRQFQALLVVALNILLTTSATIEAPSYDNFLDLGSTGKYPEQHFYTTDLTGPVANFAKWNDQCDDGKYYLITPRGDSVSKPSANILDPRGQLIWTSQFPNEYGGQIYDLRVQRYRNEDHLTFWVGDDRIRGHGQGHFYMLNSSYDLVRRITAGNGMLADLHELDITPEGTALMIVYQVIPFDVRAAGRKFADVWNQAIWDCLVQEVDIETQEVKFEWRASEHVNITDSYQSLDGFSSGTRDDPYDPFHMNSVQKDADGNYLICIRNTHAIYYVDGATGHILWTMGGKSNDFSDLSDGRALQMAWAHHAQFANPSDFEDVYHPSTPSAPGSSQSRLITVFDNAAKDYDYSYGAEASRGLLLELNYQTDESPSTSSMLLDQPHLQPSASMSKLDAEKVTTINGKRTSHSVRLIKEYTHPDKVRSGTQGSMQVVSHGPHQQSTILLGYGLNAVMTEFTPNGSVLCDIHFAAKKTWETAAVQSYRAFKQAWVGRPRVPPVAVFHGHSVFVSWNGATEVQAWTLQIPTLNGEWKTVAQVPKTEFETRLQLPKDSQHVRKVRCLALDGDGNILDHGVSLDTTRSYATVVWTNTLGEQSHLAGRVLTFAAFGGIGVVLLYHFFLRFMSWRMGRGGARYSIPR